MISIDHDDHAPSDPSSSSSSSSHHHHQHQNPHDLKAPAVDLKSTDADLHEINNPLPNFSIRDYVFGLRSKDIASNWPFSSSSLQLCLKHGAKNLLPPFESLDCLRNESSLTRCDSNNQVTNKDFVTVFDDKRVNDPLKSKEKVLSTRKVLFSNLKGSKGDKESQQGQQKSKEKPCASSQKPENGSVNIVSKRSRLVVKANSGVEHVAANSETMATKVCPVCKIFSSSSNTTLNAHIDQCLTGEGTMKWTDSSKAVIKHKVKPRKMRLMVDIYKTASHCTVEELDRRNGTSWATNSSFPDQEFQEDEDEEQEEEQEEERALTKVNPGVADNEGEVYIDTNGRKVRILSVPKTRSSNNLEDQKVIMGKKNNLYKKKHHKKYLKLVPNANKTKRGEGEDTVMAESCSKDERGKAIVEMVDLGISRPSWACSKRTRVSNNGKCRKVELECRKPKDLVAENCDKSLKSLKRMRSFVKFRREVTPVHDDDDDDVDDDDDDDDEYEDDDDDDDGSKGIKFSSLRKNQSFPAVRSNLRRKFSSVQRSRAKSDDGRPSLDSSKQQSRIEERTVINKKQETRSDASKNSNEESSVGIQTANANELASVRTGPLLSVRAPSFMGLSNSFDPEFSNHCVELYQDPICSTNRAPNEVEKQENDFKGVDPILIPGPPGSFLPASPGGEMVSEEQVQEAKVHSSENQAHHDAMDQDSMSNSPVSTVSNSRSSCGKDDTYVKPYFNARAGFTETGQSQISFKNDQPCCCARKEVALKYQEPYVSRKQLTESKSFKSELFSVNNYPNSPAGDSTVSPAKPVLRLMGKNLTVAKTDEDEFRLPVKSSQQPMIFGQHFNNHSARNHVDFGPVGPVHRGFPPHVDCYSNGPDGGPYIGPVRPAYTHNILDLHAGRNVYNVASSTRPVKEILIINDSRENEYDDSATRVRSLKGSQGKMNPFYAMYPPYIGGGGGGSWR